jgi:hypothetical protein
LAPNINFDYYKKITINFPPKKSLLFIDDDSDEDTTTNKTNQKDTEASVEKSINADTPKWPKSKEVKKEKKEN